MLFSLPKREAILGPSKREVWERLKRNHRFFNEQFSHYRCRAFLERELAVTGNNTSGRRCPPFDGRVRNDHRAAKRRRALRGRSRPPPTCSEHRIRCAERARLLSCNATAAVAAEWARCERAVAAAHAAAEVAGSPSRRGETGEERALRHRRERLQLEEGLRPLRAAAAVLSRKDHAHRHLRAALEQRCAAAAALLPPPCCRPAGLPVCTLPALASLGPFRVLSVSVLLP